ncbi:MAG TPA: hypothetical protein VNW53_11640 [Phenylobacterium sp.]|jgi:hypothetical protein|uniref:hypothetical protein n=1 Tax=Phenylobacterium sp. TaxID=1871053 RepID=UPI002B8145DC|nr:hypothetical protein [Phenylobacterium sp.]HXA39645.1 hypothetical protein [Phenylobacterium sp.]
MGDRRGPIHVLAWQRTLGEMAFHKTVLALCCDDPKCKAWTELDVAGMARFRGKATSLWDCRPPCPICGAGGHYMASLGHGTPFRPLLTPPGRKVFGLEGTANDDAPPDDPAARRKAWLRSFGFTRRDTRRIKQLAEDCRPGWAPPALDDLDVPVRVAAAAIEDRHKPNGETLGTWAGAMLLYWRLTGRDFEAWARRLRQRG